MYVKAGLLRFLHFVLQTTHFVKSRAHSPRPTRKIIATMALRRAILMGADLVVSLHAHRLFSGRACSCKKDPCCLWLTRGLSILEMKADNKLPICFLYHCMFQHKLTLLGASCYWTSPEEWLFTVITQVTEAL